MTNGKNDLEDDRLAPIIVQAMREHADSLAPDAQSRDRIWTRIEQGMSKCDSEGIVKRVRRWFVGQPIWATAVVVAIIGTIGLPLLYTPTQTPDWDAIEFKGAGSVLIDKTRSETFMAELRTYGIVFSASQRNDSLRIWIAAEEHRKMGAPFLQTWKLPAPTQTPLLIIFE